MLKSIEHRATQRFPDGTHILFFFIQYEVGDAVPRDWDVQLKSSRYSMDGIGIKFEVYPADVSTFVREFTLTESIAENAKVAVFWPMTPNELLVPINGKYTDMEVLFNQEPINCK